MVSTKNRHVPRLGNGYFECLACSDRFWSDARVFDCPSCGQQTVNIGVARE